MEEGEVNQASDPAAQLAEELAAAGIPRDLEVALVLGSGLGAFADRIENGTVVPGESLTHLPRSRVPGHAGRIVAGTRSGVRVLIQQGRVHLYEGWSREKVTRAVRAFAQLGCPTLVLTNAAGGMRADWDPGTLMRITDHIDRQPQDGSIPVSSPDEGASIYDPDLGATLDEAAEVEGIRLERGVYVANLGPAYETPAEVRMLSEMGADAVGMSTAAEAAAGHSAGMRVAAISCITNLAAGISPTPLDHDEVMEVGQRVAGTFARLLEVWLQRL